MFGVVGFVRKSHAPELIAARPVGFGDFGAEADLVRDAIFIGGFFEVGFDLVAIGEYRVAVPGAKAKTKCRHI